MKTRYVIALVATLLTGMFLRGADPFETTMQKAEENYRDRTQRAADEFIRAKARITEEKAPFLEQMRVAEDRLIAAESENTHLETRHEDFGEQRRKLLLELDGLRKTTNYITTLAHENTKAVADGLAPGENQVIGEQLHAIQQQLDGGAAVPSTTAALEAVGLLISRTEHALGGYRAPGKALIMETNQVLSGTFAFVGPETYFLPEQGGPGGAVRPREGAKYPVSYALPNWTQNAAADFFAGKPSLIVADASGGKALRLKETSGTVWEHVEKGGLVAFAIIAVGAAALVMIFQKIRDLSRMGVDSPASVATFLDGVANGAKVAAEKSVKTLGRTTNELFATGLCYLHQPKVVLEEHLEAVLLAQRLRYERRLPLLAMIATAAPLMGLFGTVVGMVRTFALITVFGTGNAGKLSSGISEVLVATELGLAVAIPTLVAHGFITHRIQRNLSSLERYALQFITAADASKAGPGGEPEKKKPVLI